MHAVERLGEQEVDRAGAEQEQEHRLAQHVERLLHQVALLGVGSSFGPSAAKRVAASADEMPSTPIPRASVIPRTFISLRLAHIVRHTSRAAPRPDQASLSDPSGATCSLLAKSAQYPSGDARG